MSDLNGDTSQAVDHNNAGYLNDGWNNTNWETGHQVNQWNPGYDPSINPWMGKGFHPYKGDFSKGSNVKGQFTPFGKSFSRPQAVLSNRFSPTGGI